MMKRLGCAILLMLLLGACAAGDETVSGEGRLIFAGTGRDADCTILLSGEDCVVVDTGEAADGPHLVELLEENGVDQVDTLILTHPDKDHVGGVPELLESVSVEEILIPRYGWEEEKPSYKAALEAAENSGVPVTELTRMESIACGAMTLTVYPPKQLHYDKSNNYSLAVLVDHGEVSAFLAGDAQKKRMQELMKLNLPENLSLYKVAHHGRESKIGAELIRKLSPDFAVVTAEAPESNIQEALVEVGAKIYTTIQQDVQFRSDGRELIPEVLEPAA